MITTKAKIMAQLHLFMLNEMLISITISGDHVKLVNYLNSKILTQQVAINDVTTLLRLSSKSAITTESNLTLPSVYLFSNFSNFSTFHS